MFTWTVRFLVEPSASKRHCVGTSARIAPESLPRFAAPAAASTPQEGPMCTAIVDTAASRHWRRLLSFLGREFREILPPTLFFFVGFNLILLTKRLILEDYLIQYAGFLVATTSARGATGALSCSQIGAGVAYWMDRDAEAADRCVAHEAPARPSSGLGIGPTAICHSWRRSSAFPAGKWRR